MHYQRSRAADRPSQAGSAVVRDYGRIRRKDYVAKIREIKMSLGGCRVCGYNEHPAALDFDHRDPAAKSFGIGHATSRTWESVLFEIAKCDLLCANCHRVKTFNDWHRDH